MTARPGATRSAGAAGTAAQRAAAAARRVAAALAAVAALAAAAGCGRSAEEQEADALLHAIDTLRNAPSEPRAGREALLAELERQPASTPPAASARDTCARAYRLLLEATAAEARVRALLEAPEGPAALSDLTDLAAADAKVKESAEVMPRCAEALAGLRRARRGM
ncbi:hypothetical protein [Sorangium sp. So ce394]|uniref:hypothetical protein n=1 Tax=Sorangium sp. So ce394 TaxID=3133310 RepID=UPI003F5B1A35